MMFSDLIFNNSDEFKIRISMKNDKAEILTSENSNTQSQIPF